MDKKWRAEYEYHKDNYLWSTIWDESFLKNNQVILFQERVKKFGYNDLNFTVKEEVPQILNVTDVKQIFKNIDINFLALWEDMPQLYIFLNLR